MSSEQKGQALNLYSILDNEMARMHTLMQAYLALPDQSQAYGGMHTNGGLSSKSSFSSQYQGLPIIFKRIMDMQDLLLAAVKSHDPLIQEKIAELALTGVSETKFP